MLDKTKDINVLAQDFSELQSYADTQYNTLQDLQKKIANLEIENRSLKSLLSNTIPDLDLTNNISNEQLICETQLVILKDAAITRSLTMEESKKFQIFITVLDAIRLNNKVIDINVKHLTEDELVKLALESNVSNN